MATKTDTDRDLELLKSHVRVRNVEKVGGGVYKITYSLPDMRKGDSPIVFERAIPLEMELTLDMKRIRRNAKGQELGSFASRDAISFILEGTVTKLPPVGDVFSCINVMNPNIHADKYSFAGSAGVDWCIHDDGFVRTAQTPNVGAYEIFLGIDRMFGVTSYNADTYSHDGSGTPYLKSVDRPKKAPK